MSKVQNPAETVSVAADYVAMVQRIADLNDTIRTAEGEAKALKGEVIEAAGGKDMVALFPEGIRVVHDDHLLATVKPQTRTTITADAVADAVESLLAAFPEVAAENADFTEALRALSATVGKSTTFPVVRTK